MDHPFTYIDDASAKADEHLAGEHDDLDVDCPDCRDEAERLGMAALLPHHQEATR